MNRSIRLFRKMGNVLYVDMYFCVSISSWVRHLIAVEVGWNVSQKERFFTTCLLLLSLLRFTKVHVFSKATTDRFVTSILYFHRFHCCLFCYFSQNKANKRTNAGCPEIFLSPEIVEITIQIAAAAKQSKEWKTWMDGWIKGQNDILNR